MKHFGDISECSNERIIDLLHTYDKYIASAKHICMVEVYEKIVNMPSSRFWVSERHATNVISAMLKGKPVLDKMRPTKREMFTEIYQRVKLLHHQHPEASLFDLCAMVVEQPAPKFYLTAGSARIMIGKARKKWREEKRKKLWPLLLYFS